jgi:tetratricopeptide (TPR) repeat protein
VNSDTAGALKYFERAVSAADSTKNQTIVGHLALCGISNTLFNTGNLLGALEHAKKAHAYAEDLGHIFPQAHSLYLQSRCQEAMANNQLARVLLEKSRDLLTSYGLQGSLLDLLIRNEQAEIHLIKTEYQESRIIQVDILSNSYPTAYQAILANLNIALIDAAIGVDSKLVRQRLEICQFHNQALYGFAHKEMDLQAERISAELDLQAGDHKAAKAKFEKCFASSQDLTEKALLCLERLGDLSTGMSNVQTTLGWAVIFLALALKCRNKNKIMRSFWCMGQIFLAHGDDETALSLFEVALEGFTLMDVHRWRADCMVRIADILESGGEIMKAAELWNLAKPLFERSSQTNDVVRMDAKLAAVGGLIYEKHKKQLLCLADLNVPAGKLGVAKVNDDLEASKYVQDTDQEDRVGIAD